MFVFNYVNNRLPICFRRRKRLIKLTFIKTELIPSSHSCCCGETDCNRVPVVHHPLAPETCADGEIPGTWQGYSCPSDPALPPSFSQSPFITWPSADGSCLLINLLILSQHEVFLTSSLAKECPLDSITKVLLSSLRTELAITPSFVFLGNSNILQKTPN